MPARQCKRCKRRGSSYDMSYSAGGWLCRYACKPRTWEEVRELDRLAWERSRARGEETRREQDLRDAEDTEKGLEFNPMRGLTDPSAVNELLGVKPNPARDNPGRMGLPAVNEKTMTLLRWARDAGPEGLWMSDRMAEYRQLFGPTTKETLRRDMQNLKRPSAKGLLKARLKRGGHRPLEGSMGRGEHSWILTEEGHKYLAAQENRGDPSAGLFFGGSQRVKWVLDQDPSRGWTALELADLLDETPKSISRFVGYLNRNAKARKVNGRTRYFSVLPIPASDFGIAEEEVDPTLARIRAEIERRSGIRPVRGNPPGPFAEGMDIAEVRKVARQWRMIPVMPQSDPTGISPPSNVSDRDIAERGWSGLKKWWSRGMGYIPVRKTVPLDKKTANLLNALAVMSGWKQPPKPKVGPYHYAPATDDKRKRKQRAVSAPKAGAAVPKAPARIADIQCAYKCGKMKSMKETRYVFTAEDGTKWGACKSCTTLTPVAKKGKGKQDIDEVAACIYGCKRFMPVSQMRAVFRIPKVKGQPPELMGGCKDCTY